MNIAALRLALFAFLVAIIPIAAQDRLKSAPGYARYERITKELPKAIKYGTLAAQWKDDGKALEFKKDGKLYRYDIAARDMKEIAAAKDPVGPGKKGGKKFFPPTGVARGRQATSALSPNGQLKAFYRDHNLWISDAKGQNEYAVTTEGNAKSRLKFGTASWVYGEELRQNTAMWWSPDGKKLAFYRFDESKVPDYFLALDQTKPLSRIDVEPYPRVGAPNPVVDLCVYDLQTKKSITVDVRNGKTFDNDVIGHYVYQVSWRANGTELFFHRTNRKQNIMEFAAADPSTGKCRTIVREEWLASWVMNSPPMRFLKDNERFIWMSETTGWKNLYLYDLSGKQLRPLTNHAFEVAQLLRVDEAAGHVYYTARSGDNPMKLQLHRVGLDGKGGVRLTDPAYHHTIDLAPDGKHFLDTIETHNSPPVTRLVDEGGKVIVELAKSDLTRFDELKLQRAERFDFLAADGKTTLYGMLHRPSTFDPHKKYPLLVRVYAGPSTNGASEVFTPPNVLAELGFLVASFDSRTASGRGKHFLDACYGKLGVVEIDDQAAGVKSLWDRHYIDKSKVGIYGSSYGGYASILCLMRHSDVFHAACASSPVTDFRLYDSIYTERYMGLPTENKAGYDAGSALTHVGKMKGRLMLFFGTADNNVHPTNTMQLISALQKAGKSYDLQIGPDQGHTSVSQARMMEFFIDTLGRK